MGNDDSLASSPMHPHPGIHIGYDAHTACGLLGYDWMRDLKMCKYGKGGVTPWKRIAYRNPRIAGVRTLTGVRASYAMAEGSLVRLRRVFSGSCQAQICESGINQYQSAQAILGWET